jgi:hypothetical protein
VIGSYTFESYYRSYTVATSGINRLAGQIYDNRLSRKKLQQNLLHMISTEVSSSATHNTALVVQGYDVGSDPVVGVGQTAEKYAVRICYALLRMRPLSTSYAEGILVFSCGKVEYDKHG